MGLTLEIRYPSNAAPGWEAIVSRLKSAGESPQLRMIDGLPAFPDEIPDSGWKELRVSFSGQMITLRRTAQGDACISWGVADPAITRAWNRLAWACAAAGDGIVHGPAGQLTAVEFEAAANLRSS